MKKFLFALPLALSLGGCPGMLPNITNPISGTSLYEGKLVFDATLKTFNELKGLCASRVLPPACRTYVNQGRKLIANAYAAEKAAVNFTTNYPALDATTVISAFTGIVSDFKTTTANLSATK